MKALTGIYKIIRFFLVIGVIFIVAVAAISLLTKDKPE